MLLSTSQRAFRRAALRGLDWSCGSSWGNSSGRTLKPKLLSTSIAGKNSEIYEDPGKYIDGAKPEDLDNPVFFAYAKANLPHIYDPEYDPEFENEGLEAWSGLDPRLMDMLKQSRREKKEKREQKKREKEEDKNHPLNMRPLHAYLRGPEDQRRGRYLRNHAGLIPGIIYGSDPRLGILSCDKSTWIRIKTPQKPLYKELNRYENWFSHSRVYNLTVYQDEEDKEGTKHVVMPTSVQWHPVGNKVYCVNFLRYHPGRPVRLPIKHVNEDLSPGLKTSFIIPIQRKIEVLIDEGVSIPDFIELDCTGLRAQDVVRRDRVILPEGIQFSKKVMDRGFIHYVIGKVYGSNRDRAATAANNASEEAKEAKKKPQKTSAEKK
ncbi:hypothetical protein ACA910_011257 [Epithemia clementina (nom. ined.)]